MYNHDIYIYIYLYVIKRLSCIVHVLWICILWINTRWWFHIILLFFQLGRMIRNEIDCSFANKAGSRLVYNSLDTAKPILQTHFVRNQQHNEDETLKDERKSNHEQQDETWQNQGTHRCRLETPRMWWRKNAHRFMAIYGHLCFYHKIQQLFFHHLSVASWTKPAESTGWRNAMRGPSSASMWRGSRKRRMWDLWGCCFFHVFSGRQNGRMAGKSWEIPYV